MLIDEMVKTNYQKIQENEHRLENMLLSMDSKQTEDYSRFEKVLKELQSNSLNLENEFDK